MRHEASPWTDEPERVCAPTPTRRLAPTTRGGPFVVDEGSVYKRCYCRDNDTGRVLGAACPELRKPRHGSWAYQFRLNPGGKQHRRGGFKSQTDAHSAMQQARAELGRTPVEAVEPPLSTRQWLLFWLAEKEQLGGASAAGRKVAATTARGYRAHLELYLIPALGDIPLSDLAAHDIARLFRDLEAAQSTRSRPLTPASIRRVYSTLRSALNAAVRQQKLKRNPALQIDLASGGRPKAMVWTRERVAVWQRTGKRPSPVMVWTPEQTGAFLDSAAQDPLYALYHLIALRGLRRGEAVGLSWADLDLDGGWLLVREQVVQLGWRTLRTTPKAGSERVLALDAGTAAVLAEHRQRQAAELRYLGLDPAATAEVFTRADGQLVHPDYVTRHFGRLVRQAGLPPIRVHDLRHGAATLALASGVEMKVVQDMLSHSSITITSDTYTSVLPQVARSAAEATAGMVPRALVSRALVEHAAVLPGAAGSAPPSDSGPEQPSQP